MDSATEQLAQLKDRMHDKLTARSASVGDCWLWLGAHQKDGAGVIRIRGQSFRVARIAWWVYSDLPFNLWATSSLRVLRTCPSPGCFNPDHHECVRGQGGMMRRLAQLGRFKRKHGRASKTIGQTCGTQAVFSLASRPR